MAAESRVTLKTMSRPVERARREGFDRLRGFAMHKLLVAALVWILGFAAYSARTNASSVARSLTPEQSSAVETAVRAFAQNFAHDVTQEGPTAWHKSLEDSPAFFMAVDGAMAFPNSAAAKAGVDTFAATIELTWNLSHKLLEPTQRQFLRG